jgi:hypothetical protein
MSLLVLEESVNLVRVQNELGNDFWITRERLNQVNMIQPPKTIQSDQRTKREFYLGPKMESVLELMKDKQFRTLADISLQTGYESLTGLSAGIRSLRKFGHTVEKRKLENQPEYEYRLI